MKTIIFFTCLILLTSCSEEEEESIEELLTPLAIQEAVTLNKVQRIANAEFKLNNNDTISITAGPGRQKFIVISIYRSNINDGYAAMTLSNNDSAITVEASWDGESFTQSNTHATSVNFEFVSLDSANLLATMKLSAILVNPETGLALEISESTLEIGGLNFYTLTEGVLSE